ncbi:MULTISPECIES: hypothetical protein [Rhodopseudomonas]|uniref:hypothetical protein n=1 Tax=Rhodopseudomonas TaxID=1073 RepID=UPI00128E66EC|nr:MULTISPECIES: hypothetical protein [Rhodopseudomonas]MDF3812292.1 hypothetical protein [Rhodopseudomonas sp. BAL398]WOK17434.1 hypothetical protein RBJ75_25495 [Rhodopseudomonas sp. BAL398]
MPDEVASDEEITNEIPKIEGSAEAAAMRVVPYQMCLLGADFNRGSGIAAKDYPQSRNTSSIMSAKDLSIMRSEAAPVRVD